LQNPRLETSVGFLLEGDSTDKKTVLATSEWFLARQYGSRTFIPWRLPSSHDKAAIARGFLHVGLAEIM
jgi:hypothetical protein